MPVKRPSPKGPILVRNPMGHLTEPNKSSYMLPTTRKDFAGGRPSTGTRFGQLSHSSFFARHNPHPGRVRHIKGLLDVPICAVHDDGYISNPTYTLSRPNTTDGQKYMYSSKVPVNSISYNVHNLNPTINTNKYPLDTITGLSNFPFGFKEKAGKYGLVPLTDSWKDELRSLTNQIGFGLSEEVKEQEEQQPPKRTSVYSAETGRLIPPPSRAMSRSNSRKKNQKAKEWYHHIAAEQDKEALIMEMLCQILQTDSITAVQAWLISAGQREKTIVIDMIKNALNYEEEYYNCQQSGEYMEGLTERPKTQPPASRDDQLKFPDLGQKGPTPASRMSRYEWASQAGSRGRMHTAASLKEIIKAPSYATFKRDSKPDILKLEHSPRPPTMNGEGKHSLKPTTPSRQEMSRHSWRPEDSTAN